MAEWERWMLSVRESNALRRAAEKNPINLRLLARTIRGRASRECIGGKRVSPLCVCTSRCLGSWEHTRGRECGLTPVGNYILFARVSISTPPIIVFCQLIFREKEQERERERNGLLFYIIWYWQFFSRVQISRYILTAIWNSVEVSSSRNKIYKKLIGRRIYKIVDCWFALLPWRYRQSHLQINFTII